LSTMFIDFRRFSTIVSIFTDFQRFASIFMAFHRFSKTSIDFHRFSPIFTDFQRFSAIFSDFHRFSAIFHDFYRFPTILGRPAVSGSIGNKSPDSGRPAVQKSLPQGEKGPDVSTNCQPNPRSKTLTKRSSREQGEKTLTKRSRCQCQFWATKSRPDLATTCGHFKKRKKTKCPEVSANSGCKQGGRLGEVPEPKKLSIFRAADFASGLPGFRRRRGNPFGPYLHARIPKITVVCRTQASSNYMHIYILQPMK